MATDGVVVGLCLESSSEGALAFARWLHQGGSTWSSGTIEGAVRLTAVHVLEERAHRYSPTLVTETTPRLRRALEHAGLGDRVDGPHLTFGSEASEELLREVVERDARLLVVGMARDDPSDGSWTPLGRTLRGLLAGLVRPTAFVPRGVRTGTMGRGSVLVVQELGQGGAAWRYGTGLAETLGRDVDLMLSCPVLEGEPRLATGEAARSLLHGVGPDHSAAFDGWCRRAERVPERVAVVGEEPHRGVLAWVGTHRVPVVVCGVSGAGALDRYLNPPLAQALLDCVPCPVILVPEPMGV